MRRATVYASSYVALHLCLSAQSKDNDQVIELSPFQVDGSGDVGYLAGSTLAGTRLNSNLTDVAAAISPFTKEFMEDIGADSMEQLLTYSNNTTRLDSTELANDNQVIEFEFQFNVRGLPASRARNYFAWDVISMDNFNVERVDESRGPNSILFGVGSAGGVINTSTKQARFTEINEVQFMVGSNSQVRGAVDFNRVLIEDKLAIRFNAMWDEDESWRYFEFKNQKRFHLASTWRAGAKTTIRGEIEWGEVKDNLGRAYLGVDYVTDWVAAGSPNRSVSTANNAQRQNAWIHVDNDNATFFAGTGNNRSFYTNFPNGVRELVDEESDLFQWKANPGGPDNTRETDYTTWSVFLEQRVGDKLNFEAAFNHLETTFLQYDSGGSAYDLRGDTNDPNLNTGPINDRSGGLFYENSWGIRTRDREADTVRLTGSYELELPDNWGRHRFAAMYETMDSNSARESAFEQLADANGILYVPTAPGAATTNGQNRIWRRHYVTPGDFSTYHAASWKDPVSVTRNGNTYTNQWFPVNQNVQDDDLGLDSMLVSMQNFWFDGKVITTYGFRKDDITIDKRSPTTDPNNQRIVVDYDTPAERFSYSGDTTTLGVVLKPTKWLSFLFNDSDNQGLPDVNRLVLPNSNFADPSTGQGKDYGLMLNLLEGRVFARLAKYESSMIGLTAFGNRGNVENPNNRILDVLQGANLINASQREAREVITNTYTFGRESQGYEFEVTANITKNWSVRFNYSETERVQFNIMPEVLAWYPGEDEFWRSFGDTVYNNIGPGGPGTGIYTPPSGFNSIALESDRVQRHIDNNIAFEGLGDQGSRDRSGNIFTNYRFTEGVLKGFNIGGGVRYLGPLSVTVDLANESLVWGNSNTLFDFLVGYRTKLNDKIGVKFQLNVRNVFDKGGYIIAGQELDGRLSQMAFVEPREIQFRTTFNW